MKGVTEPSPAGKGYRGYTAVMVQAGPEGGNVTWEQKGHFLTEASSFNRAQPCPSGWRPCLPAVSVSSSLADYYFNLALCPEHCPPEKHLSLFLQVPLFPCPTPSSRLHHCASLSCSLWGPAFPCLCIPLQSSFLCSALSSCSWWWQPYPPCDLTVLEGAYLIGLARIRCPPLVLGAQAG